MYIGDMRYGKESEKGVWKGSNSQYQGVFLELRFLNNKLYNIYYIIYYILYIIYMYKIFFIFNRRIKVP